MYMLINENQPSKMELFFRQRIFFRNFDSNNGCKNEFEANHKKSAADLEIGFSKKSILKPF